MSSPEGGVPRCQVSLYGGRARNLRLFYVQTLFYRGVRIYVVDPNDDARAHARAREGHVCPPEGLINQFVKTHSAETPSLPYPMRMSTWTPERRAKQAEVAKRLIQEGRFGGPGRGQGRKRKKRVSEFIAEQVEAEAQTLYDRLMTIAREANPTASLGAINQLLAIEEKERQIQEREEERLEDMHRDELLAGVVSMLGELMEGGVIPNVIDGIASEVVDFEDRAVDGPRALPEGSEGSAGQDRATD